MKFKIFLLYLLFAASAVSAQTGYTPVNGSFSWTRGVFRDIIGIPFVFSNAAPDSGKLAFKDRMVWYQADTGWTPLAALPVMSDSMELQTLQRVTDKGNRTTNGIGSSWLELNTQRTGSVANGGAVLVQRTIPGTNVRAKGFIDNTTVNVAGGSYAAYDVLVYSTSGKVDSIIGLQSRMEVNTADTVSKINAVYHFPSVRAGHLRDNIPIEIRDIQFTGGTVGRSIGLRIHPLTYAASNQAIRVEDAPYTSYIGSYTGFRKENPQFPLEVGNGPQNVAIRTEGRILVQSTQESKDSAAVQVARTIESGMGADENNRGFQDATFYNKSGRSYANFDAAASLGSTGHNHIAAFQSRIGIRATGNVTSMFGVVAIDSIFSGTVGERSALDIRDVAMQGGTLAANYGLRIKGLSAATANTGILVETLGGQTAIEVKHPATGNITQTLYNRSTAGVGDQSLIKWKASSVEGAAIGMELRSGTTADFVIKTNNAGTTNLSERVRVTGAGLVGINETTAGAQLDVRGTSSTTGAALRVRNSTPNSVFQVDNNGDLTIFGGTKILTGASAPEGAVAAPPGSHYMRNTGGAGTSFYVKESGSGNTGWVAYGPSATPSGYTQVTDANYTVTATDRYIWLPQTTALRTLTLPTTATIGRELFIRCAATGPGQWQTDATGIVPCGYVGPAIFTLSQVQLDSNKTYHLIWTGSMWICYQ